MGGVLVFELKNVSKAFDRRVVLSDVNLAIRRGFTTGIVGPSGGGKSVLLKIIANVYQPDSGCLVFNKVDESAGGISQEETNDANGNHKPLIGFAFQEGALFDSISVIQNVAFPLLENWRELGHIGGNTPVFGSTFRKSTLKNSYLKASEILEKVGLGNHLGKHPGQLSGGMRRRVAIARALVASPELVLLDDPTGGLDPVTSSKIMDLIVKLQYELKSTLIIVSHDIRRLIPNIDQLVALFDGCVVANLRSGELPDGAPLSVVNFLSRRYSFKSLEPQG